MLLNNAVQRENHSSSIHDDIRIKGQIYLEAFFLLPFIDGQLKFLQMCFIRDPNDEFIVHCRISTDIKMSIVFQLQ